MNLEFVKQASEPHQSTCLHLPSTKITVIYQCSQIFCVGAGESKFKSLHLSNSKYFTSAESSSQPPLKHTLNNTLSFRMVKKQMKNVPHRLRCLIVRFPIGGTVWVCLRALVLLKESVLLIWALRFQSLLPFPVCSCCFLHSV